MTFYVDAWLDCPKPYVKVVNKYNHQVLAQFSGPTLQNALEQGDICVCDCLDADQENQLELVKSLLLLCCCQSVKDDLHAFCSRLPKRQRLVSNDSNNNVLQFQLL